MKNYKQTASDVLRLVGGEKNVVQVEHCSTRLRFTLADTSKADVAALKKTAGVMGVISSGPQCQVVIGNDVIEVYDELLKLGTFNAGQAAAPAAPKGKKEIGGIILDYMVGIFQPLVPAIAGAGVLKALMVLLSTLGVMSSGDIAYKVFVGVADAALYYLPVMVAFTTATKFNCNKLVSVALAAAMIHPSVSALLATEGGAYFLGIKLQNIAYGGQVFPAILTVIFMSFIEKWANKWCPKAIRVFFVPMLCFGIGFHPAFNVPFDDKHTTTDYEFRFDRPESPVILDARPNGLLSGKSYYQWKNQQAIPLTDDLFANDSFCMAGLRTGTIGICEKDTGRNITCKVEGYPYSLIWSAPAKPVRFVCIEPWHSLPAAETDPQDWEQRAAAACLAPGESWQTTLSTTFDR